MNEQSTNDISDATLYLSLLNFLVSESNFDEISTIFQQLRYILNNNQPLRYTNISNILSLLIFYTSPTKFDINEVILLADFIINEKQAVDCAYDFEEFVSFLSKISNNGVPQNALLKTTDDLLLDCYMRNKKYNFGMIEGTQDEMMFQFVKSKTYHTSQYISELGQYSPYVKKLENYDPYNKWYYGLIQPYIYYWDNYACLNSDSIDFKHFIKLQSYSEQFQILIDPLSRDNYSLKISIENWMSNVIIPLAIENSNFKPLSKWLYHREIVQEKPFHKYNLWYQTLKTLRNEKNISIESYSEIIEYFLGACYYYAFKSENSDQINSIEIMKIYALITDTLNLFADEENQKNNEFSDIKLPGVLKYDSLELFLQDSSNPIRSLIIPNSKSIRFLKEIVEFSQKLHPVNRMTVSQYLKLKFSDEIEISSKEAEVAKILSSINNLNWNKLFLSARMFCENFIPADNKNSINKLIVERFLTSNLFDVVSDFYEGEELGIEVNDFFELIEKKFWYSFDQATNFNENSGKLHNAMQCVKLFDKLSSDSNLSDSHREKNIKIRHLLKALSNLKNFKIVIDKNMPFTPYLLVTRFSSVSSDSLGHDDNLNSPLNLISIILEQNPKSYLAFEKLYKILNDLLLFFDDKSSFEAHPSNFYFDKLKSACIESALIDNNFSFAYKKSKELFDYYSDSNEDGLGYIWLTFYQVGKYVSPLWFDDSVNSSAERINILMKQREILSLTLQLPITSDAMIDNSKIILNQWEAVNVQIEDYFKLIDDEQKDQRLVSSGSCDMADSVGNLANSIINDATNSTGQASEKLSNLFVSGLGWAIGANN